MPSATQTGASEPVADDEAPQTIIAVLTEHLSLALLSRTHSVTLESESVTREWDRLIIAYLSLLAQWLWEEPRAVREFLENGGMGVVSK